MGSQILAESTPERETPLEERINIDIPKDEIEAAEIDQLLGAIAPYVQDGAQKVPLADVAAKIEIDGDFKEILNQIIPTRETFANVSCKARRCSVSSIGNEFTFRIESINIPILGVPVVTLGKEIDLILELSEDLTRFEICRIEGIKARVGAVNNRVDGALIEKEGELIKTLKIDVGVGGDYPKKDCV
jgi:hypothetical protein